MGTMAYLRCSGINGKNQLRHQIVSFTESERKSFARIRKSFSQWKFKIEFKLFIKIIMEKQKSRDFSCSFLSYFLFASLACANLLTQNFTLSIQISAFCAWTIIRLYIDSFRRKNIRDSPKHQTALSSLYPATCSSRILRLRQVFDNDI